MFTSRMCSLNIFSRCNGQFLSRFFAQQCGGQQLFYNCIRLKPLNFDLACSGNAFLITAKRSSSSDVYQHLNHDFRLENLASAKMMVDHFRPEERALLLKILSEECKKTKNCPHNVQCSPENDYVHFRQLKQVFVINTIPFIGFGILDNMIMILAGEYIDQTIGTFFGISTMAAAALGNIISDVAGVGLAHYVELLVVKCGFRSPELTAQQMSHEPYFATYIEDLEQDPFDAVEFVERLAWRMSKAENVDATFLKNKFEEEIGSLQLLSEQFQSKINVLEQQQNQNKASYLDTLSRLYDRNAESLEKLKQLDGTMQTISAKVVHLGDQLESVHAPRARAFEALQLMRHFDEFLAADQSLSSPIFTDPDRLLEAAEIIHKLSSIASELSREKYAAVQMRIAHKYDEIEELLIEEFAKSHDRKRLREIATILSEFKGFSRCLDDFVERVQNSAFRSGNVFEDILVLCEKTSPMLVEIFPNPGQVMAKLILNVFHGKLQDTVNAKLRETKDDPEAYLTNLSDLYSKILKLQKSLETFKSDSDPQFLPTLVQSIFGPYLVTYAKIEKKFIHDQCTTILRIFYESKGHQKRNIQVGGLQDLKRDIQARLLTVENYGNETFLSEEVAINLIQEIKNALTRCNLLCRRPESLELTEYLFDMLVKYLYTNHLDYAVELALAAISLAEPKVQPSINFFGVVQQSSSITHLFVKNFDDVIHSLVKGIRIEESIIEKRDQTLANVEDRLNLGLERQINVIIGYVRFVLVNEQKKSDFKPEDESVDICVMSKACSTVSEFLRYVLDRIKENVDGGNLKTILNELAERFYSTLLNHIRSFNYNTTGAMLLLCDINEYKRCVNTWGVREGYKKFELLRELANLLVVVPDNLSKASISQTLVTVDRDLVNSFIQLRHDFKSARLYLNCY